MVIETQISSFHLQWFFYNFHYDTMHIIRVQFTFEYKCMIMTSVNKKPKFWNMIHPLTHFLIRKFYNWFYSIFQNKNVVNNAFCCVYVNKNMLSYAAELALDDRINEIIIIIDDLSNYIFNITFWYYAFILISSTTMFW